MVGMHFAYISKMQISLHLISKVDSCLENSEVNFCHKQILFVTNIYFYTD